MDQPPLNSTAPPRRHRSRQRERILEWVRETDSHPTAAEIHDALRSELTTLSLGTVYRNLEVLVGDGDLDEVAGLVGATRYDGNLCPHHHFNCERCGRILDVDLPPPRGLSGRVERDLGVRPTRIRISFFGFCDECERNQDGPSERISGVAPDHERTNQQPNRNRRGKHE